LGALKLEGTVDPQQYDKISGMLESDDKETQTLAKEIIMAKEINNINEKLKWEQNSSQLKCAE
jgi:hypothetical protein